MTGDPSCRSTWDLVEIGRIVHLEDEHLHAEQLSSGLRRVELPGAGRRIAQNRDTTGSWHCCSDEFEPFAGQAGLVEKQPSDVPSRPGEAAGVSSCHRIGLEVDRDDRYRVRRTLRGPDGRRTDHHESGDVSSEQLPDQIGERLELSTSESHFEGNRLPLDIAEPAQPLLQRSDGPGRTGRFVVQDAYYWDCLRPLRSSCARCDKEAAGHRADERPPRAHWMIWYESRQQQASGWSPSE